jgi:hypothetical protein
MQRVLVTPLTGSTRWHLTGLFCPDAHVHAIGPESEIPLPHCSSARQYSPQPAWREPIVSI